MARSPFRDNILLAILFFVFLTVSVCRISKDLPGVISSDVEGYYLYLPAVFIQRSVHHIPPGNMDYRKNDKGEVVIKFTCGVAYCYLPFFLVAHTIAHFHHLNASGTPGLSYPYFYGIIVCGVFWAFMGLFFLKTLLLKFFSARTTWLTLICIMLGTNFFHYATYSLGMSHVYSFALVAAILLLTYHYYNAPRRSIAILLGFLMGWLILIRPTNCLLALFVLLFNVVSLQDIKQRLAFLKTRLPDLLLAVPFMLLPMIPQFLYWKEMTGRWITYSYEGEGFPYWSHPKIAAVLFDTQNGLFLYSPVLLLLCYGLLAGRKDQRTQFMGASLVFISITYVFASWWTWWFGGAFGHRCYIEYLPVFAFPMAIAVEKIAAMKKAIKLPVAAVVIVLLYYSVAMSFVYTASTQRWDGPAWRWNWGKWAEEVRQII